MAESTKKKHEQWLLDLTAVPTVAGREWRVAAYLRQWVKARRSLAIKADKAGNLTISRRIKSKSKTPPIYLQAHMDHPAFVVHRVIDPRTLLAEFRGGVHNSYFAGSPVLLHCGDKTPAKGRVVDFEKNPPSSGPMIDDSAKILRITFSKNVQANPGDVITWDTGKTRVAKNRLHTPACDDLAAVAAALGAYDQWLVAARRSKSLADVRLLFTRAEEIGFIGTIAACKAGSVPKNARMICLENSKSFPESPIDGGPIVRVGDYASTFSPELTYSCAAIAQALVKEDPTFRFQRKLMPGGTCEASAYQAWGYQATCLCLPLGNYHNMNEATGKIAAETISLNDFHGLVRLLTAIAQHLDDPAQAPSLLSRLEQIYAKRAAVLDE